MGAILLQVALHMAIMLGRAHWHCWSPMHPRPFGTSEPMPRALDPVGCAWTEGSYAQLDIFDWLPEPRSEHQTGNSKLRVACLRSSALVWPLSDIYLSHPVGKLTDFSDSCWAEPPKRPAGCLGKPVVELLRLRDRSLVLITEMSPTDLPCEGCESPDVRYELDLNQELMVAWVRRQDVCGRQMAFPAQRWTEFVVQGMYTYPDYVNSPPADITGNCEREGLVVFGGVKIVNQMIPNARTWALRIDRNLKNCRHSHAFEGCRHVCKAANEGLPAGGTVSFEVAADAGDAQVNLLDGGCCSQSKLGC